MKLFQREEDEKMATDDYDERKAQLLSEARDSAEEITTAASERVAKAAGQVQEAAKSDEKEEEKKETVYMVLQSQAEKGPWAVLGEFSGHGQTAAKKQAAAALGDKATNLFFIAIPKSSYVPQRPAVKTTTTISF